MTLFNIPTSMFVTAVLLALLPMRNDRSADASFWRGIEFKTPVGMYITLFCFGVAIGHILQAVDHGDYAANNFRLLLIETSRSDTVSGSAVDVLAPGQSAFFEITAIPRRRRAFP